MRISRSTPLASRLAGCALALALACLATSCAGPGAPKSGKLELQEGGSFVITERERFGSDVRDDFEEAIRRIEAEDYASGIALLERVTEAAPHAATAHIDLAIAYRLTGEFAKAEASLGRALALNGRHPMAHNELGIVLRKQGRFAEARASYERALAIASEFHFARRNLAILCDVYLGDLACALEHYERYAQAVPDDAQAAMWVADLRKRVAR